MLEKGLKIQVKGIPFKESEYTEFKFLKDNPNKKRQSTILYGRNGSGKTSLTKALSDLKKDEADRTFDLILTGGDNKPVNIDTDTCLYIFNEDFIDSQVKFKSDGLDTIVLLGEDAVDEAQIKTLEESIDNIKQELEKIDLNIYNDPKNVNNPKFYMDKMIKILKQDDNWASRQQQIKKKSRKDSVSIQTIFDIEKNHSQKVTLKDFRHNLDEYLKIETDEKCNDVFSVPINSYNETKFENLLNKKLSQASTDDLAERIYATIEMHNETRTNEIIESFSTDIEYCPYCFRPIVKDEKEEIVEKIKSVLSKESDEFLLEISQMKVEECVKKDLPSFIKESTSKEYHFAIENYNSNVRKVNETLEIKKVNMYVSLKVPEDLYLKEALDILINAVAKINAEISNYNVGIDNKKIIEKRLYDQNNYLSWLTIKDDYDLYNIKLKEKELVFQKHNTLIQNLQSEKEKLGLLNDKKKNIDEACREIKNNLDFIFLDSKRLTLDIKDNHYVVKSNGLSVSLDKLSTGERNVIALCYFFCSIGQGKKFKTRYEDEYLIIVDDPISSFDHDNKIGIYSLLREKVKQYVNSNFVFLTHNYEVAYNLSKVFSDVYGPGNETGKKVKHITNYMEIGNLKVLREPINLTKGANQYCLLLDGIYKFANKEDSELTELTIGNSLRRVLEMFSTFEYNTGFEKIIDKITGDTYIDQILKNYMFRIMVNNESHTMLKGYAFDDVDHFEMFSLDEKIKTAKLTLILLEHLNTTHLKSYLGEEKIDTINDWKEEIQTQDSLDKGE